MSQLLKNGILIFITGLISAYLLLFLSSYLVNTFLALEFLKTGSFAELGTLLWLVLVGLSLSLLASLCAWPFSLSIATMIEQNKSRQHIDYINYALKFLASMPLVFYAYLFLEVVGADVFRILESFWVESFASSNLLTQVLAFALTLLLYPLTIIPWLLEPVSVDVFFQKMLVAVIDFAEVGLVSSVVVCGLIIYILPQMVLRMLKYLQRDQNLIKHEVIQSIGGTRWESIYMTVLQSMREHFNIIILRFTRVCFFEGLITFSLLSFFFKTQESLESHWGATLSSLFIGESLVWEPGTEKLRFFSGALILVYVVFIGVERFYLKKLGSYSV